MTNLKKVARFPAGVIEMPPSKSVLHRALICAGLAEGKSEVYPFSSSEDIDATARCMQKIKTPGAILDCGESGSTLRFLIPVAAALSGRAFFKGRGRLLSRPLGPYFDTLSEHEIELSPRDGGIFLSGRLRPGVYRLPGDVSSQFVSGLLFALPILPGDSEIGLTTPLESRAYVDLTRDVMESFGVRAEEEGGRFLIRGGQRYRPSEFFVEGDYSQAAFFLAASALGSECEVRGLSPDSKQGDFKILEILRKSGAAIFKTSQGGLVAKPGRLSSQTVDVSDIPDLVPPLAAFFCFCEGESRIINASRLRIKESDRLAAVSEELQKLGANIKIERDSLVIEGGRLLKGGVLNARNDHRIAMMGALAAVKSAGEVFIEGSDCVRKSYPDFWRDFEKKEWEARS